MKPAEWVLIAIGAYALLSLGTRAGAWGQATGLINGNGGAPGAGYAAGAWGNGITAGYRNVAPGGIGGTYNRNPWANIYGPSVLTPADVAAANLDGVIINWDE